MSNYAELRARAKVPIIACIHRCGVSCDISFDISSKSTTEEVQELYAISPIAFRCLCTFLKVYLWSYGLDKPFTGGIGSFKLYVMIALILNAVPKECIHSHPPDVGFILIQFFHYYSKKKNFNINTMIRVGTVSIELSSVTKADLIRLYFKKAYDILSSITTSSTSSTMPEQIEEENPSLKTSTSNSTSILGLILSSALVHNRREQAYIQCRNIFFQMGIISDSKHHLNTNTNTSNTTSTMIEIPDYDIIEKRRNEISSQILSDIQQRMMIARKIAIEDVIRLDACLGCRLRSFPNVNDIYTHSRMSNTKNNVQQRNDNNSDYNYPKFTTTGVIGCAFRSHSNQKNNNNNNNRKAEYNNNKKKNQYNKKKVFEKNNYKKNNNNSNKRKSFDNINENIKDNQNKRTRKNENTPSESQKKRKSRNNNNNKSEFSNSESKQPRNRRKK